MKKAIAAAAIAAFFTISASGLSAQRNEVRRVEDALDVFRQIITEPDKEVPAYMMTDAWGLAIIPGVQKAALVVGGQYGKGVMVGRKADGSWSSPVFITFKGGSIGWQIGVQSVDLLLFFKTRKSLEGVLGGSFTLGVDASIAAGSLGRQAGASTDTDLSAEILSYARARGIFAGLTVAGATLEIDHDADSLYYGRSVSAEDILAGKGIGTVQSAADLARELDSYRAARKK
jgi:lipid-binding SYLF domain-containing protein